jgi:F-type H+-transporting ATPase subunit a
MSEPSPLASRVLFHVGPVGITDQVATTWGIVVALSLVAFLATRRLATRPGRAQAAAEALVLVVEDQIRGVMRRDPRPFLPLLGGLFLFIATANLCSLLPGVRSPTASLETPLALALIVFFSVHAYGIREKGLWKYLKGYAEPSVLMLPLHVLSEITRTFSLMVRLVGNIMSHELIIGVVVALAGLVVPIPFMALGVLIGLVQAYIFTILAAVFIGAAVGASETQKGREQS